MVKYYEKYQFCLIEDVPSWNKDPPLGTSNRYVVPKGATLVLFDSVSVPHEVCEVFSNSSTSNMNSTSMNNRLALAGWFHEKIDYLRKSSD